MVWDPNEGRIGYLKGNEGDMSVLRRVDPSRNGEKFTVSLQKLLDPFQFLSDPCHFCFCRVNAP